jgi:hypothetical protein
MCKCEGEQANVRQYLEYYCDNCKRVYPVEIPLEYCPSSKCNPPTILILREKEGDKT